MSAGFMHGNKYTEVILAKGITAKCFRDKLTKIGGGYPIIYVILVFYSK